MGKERNMMNGIGPPRQGLGYGMENLFGRTTTSRTTDSIVADADIAGTQGAITR